MTEAELEAIGGRHGVSAAPEIDPYCRGCRKFWPCDAARLLSEVERLRGVVAERDQEIERMALRYGMRQLPALEEGE